MKVLSLFDGISCARVALERAGIPVEVYYASEIDKYAMQVSQKNYPDIVQIGDVKNIKLKCEECDGSGSKSLAVSSPIWISEPTTSAPCQCKIRGHISSKLGIDLLIGGSPCQDLSIAKKDRKGLDGERSGLFWEYVRVLKEVQPKWFILENVASMPKEAKQIITDTLGVEPIMINAALVSAQNRKRLFWTNIPNVTLPEDRGILLKDILEKDFTDKEKSLALTATYSRACARDYFVKSNRQMVFVGDIFALTEKRTEEAKKIRKEFKQKYGKDYSPRRKKELMPREDGKANTITTGLTKEHFIFDTNCVRRLSPTECERLQGLPDGYTEGVSNTQRYKALGNAFNVDVVAHIIKQL